MHGVLLLSLLHGGQSLHWATQVHKHSGWAVTLAILKTTRLHIMVCCICRVHEINSLLAPFDYTTQPSWQNPKFLGEWRCRKRMMTVIMSLMMTLIFNNIGKVAQTKLKM